MPSADAAHLWDPLAVTPTSERATIDSLFTAARKGDRQASEELCRLMRPSLYRLAFSYLKDRDEADDVAQEALVRGLTRRFVLMPKGSAQGFLLRVASNLAKNRLRDGKRRRELLHDEEERAKDATVGAAARAPDMGLSHAEESARVEAALATLSPRQREVVRLRLIGELSFADVAVALGIREENARVTFSQAKARLKEALGAQGFGDQRRDGAGGEP